MKMNEALAGLGKPVMKTNSKKKPLVPKKKPAQDMKPQGMANLRNVRTNG